MAEEKFFFPMTSGGPDQLSGPHIVLALPENESIEGITFKVKTRKRTVRVPFKIDPISVK